jgi:hypothetical protein
LVLVGDQQVDLPGPVAERINNLALSDSECPREVLGQSPSELRFKECAFARGVAKPGAGEVEREPKTAIGWLQDVA